MDAKEHLENGCGLVLLTEPLFDEAPGDEGCGESGESEVDVGSALVTGCKAAKLAEPSKRALHHPSMPPKPCAALNAAAGDASLDVAAGQGATAAAMVVGFVGVELARSSSRRSPGLLDGRNGIDHLFQHPAVVDVGSRQRESERDALCIGEDMPLGACLAAICWVGTCR